MTKDVLEIENWCYLTYIHEIYQGAVMKILLLICTISMIVACNLFENEDMKVSHPTFEHDSLSFSKPFWWSDLYNVGLIGDWSPKRSWETQGPDSANEARRYSGAKVIVDEPIREINIVDVKVTRGFDTPTHTYHSYDLCTGEYIVVERYGYEDIPYNTYTLGNFIEIPSEEDPGTYEVKLYLEFEEEIVDTLVIEIINEDYKCDDTDYNSPP